VSGVGVVAGWSWHLRQLLGNQWLGCRLSSTSSLAVFSELNAEVNATDVVRQDE
jgi:hypothetical protein